MIRNKNNLKKKKKKMKSANIKIVNNSIIIDIFEFPSHVKLTEKRRKKYKDKIVTHDDGSQELIKVIVNSKTVDTPRWTKINGQYMYNGNWNEFQRRKVFDTMHSFILSSIEKSLTTIKVAIKFPVEIELEIHTLKSHGGIKMLGNKLIIPTKEDKSNSNWDIGNLGFAWSKAIDDCLHKLNIIPDDSIQYVKSTGKVTFIPIECYENRKIVVKIKNTKY